MPYNMKLSHFSSGNVKKHYIHKRDQNTQFYIDSLELSRPRG
jgi:hypothetical protein